MSDTGKTILWIVVALVVIAVIFWLFVSARRSREADARRFEASELRAQVQERRPQVQDQEDRASVTARMAAEARAEADEKAAAARNLEEHAEQHQATAEAARAEHEDLARRADLVDPDVPTDAEGYLVDDSGHRFAGQGPSEAAGQGPDEPAETGEPAEAGERAGTGEPAEPVAAGSRAATLGAGAGVVAAGALGAAYTNDEDDEEDLADAENPFAASVPAASEPEPAAASEPEPSAAAPDEPAERDSAAAPDEPAEGPDEPAEQAEEPVERPDEPAEQAEERVEQAEEPPGTASGAASDEHTEPDLETTSPAAAVAEAVPALQERDTHVALGGTPGGDPGDHRGQPWATTPGAPGLEQDTAEPDAEQPEPALDTGQGVDGMAGQDDDNAPRPTGEEETGRRISTFEEVTDGGFGIGSAAPIADGAQPLGHAVKGTRDGRTFLAPDDEGYDGVEPDVWFYTEEAARRAGFSREGE